MKKVAYLLVMFSVLFAGSAFAAATPQQKCEQSKLKAIGKLQSCLAKQRANVVVGKIDDSATCEAKFDAAILKADTKADAAGASCRYLANPDSTVIDLNHGTVCGDGVANGDEACDGNDRNGSTCSSATPATPYGELGCAACSFVTTQCTGRYVDNGNGTVTDLSTNLMWEKKDDAGGIHDKDNVYGWSLTFGGDPDGTLFTSFLYGLNQAVSGFPVATTGCFAGHCDWRIPTIEELSSIMGAGCACVDSELGPTGAFLWTSVTLSSSPDHAFIWSDGFGLTTTDSQGYAKYIDTLTGARAVRTVD